MATTTVITNIAHLLDLTGYVGSDFINDYDMDAVHADYVDYLDEQLPQGIRLHANGDVIADLALADEARGINWAEFLGGDNSAEVIAILKSHDSTLEREVVVRAVPGPGQEQQVISREPYADELPLYALELSAQDLGCTPGALYLVEVVDVEDDEVLRSVQVVAR